VTVLAAALLLLSVVGSAVAVYAIYRFGVIPAFRSLLHNEIFRDMWETGGWLSRASLFGILIGFLIGVLGCVILINGLVWQGGLIIVAGLAFSMLCNYLCFRNVRPSQKEAHGAKRP
jgi:glucan phosphoethanolaminetransferase (alkaline phosphatase superfamily)